MVISLRYLQLCTVEIGVFCPRVVLPLRVILAPCMPLFLHNTIYIENIVCFCYLYHAKMYNLNVFRSGYFAP